MIDYEEEWLMKLLFKREGSVAASATLYGLCSAGFAVLLLVAVELDTSQTVANLLKEISKSQLWNASTVVIVLLLGFRTKTAMSRFWEGTGLLHQMRGEWFDTVSNCVTFSIGAKGAKSEAVTRFRHTLVRLMSLCHATALEEIASSTIKLEAIDTFGLDTKTLKHLTDCSRRYKFNQVEIMVHLIQTLITAAHEDGVLKIPPPILSRVYQTLSRGFVNLLNAKKICDTRFPFPYAQMIAILLLLSTILTPMQIAAAVESKSMAAVFAFVPVWGLVALNLVANQLEDPFGTDSNDLPLEHFQSEMNACLLMLLHPDSDHIPSVVDSCTLNFSELLSTMQVADGKAIRYSHSFTSSMSKRLSSFESKQGGDGSNGYESEDTPMERILSDCSSRSQTDIHLQHTQVLETKQEQDVVEYESTCEGFTVPAMPAFPIQPAREFTPLEEEKDECKAVQSVSNYHAEQIINAAHTAASSARMPQVAPARTSPPDSTISEASFRCRAAVPTASPAQVELMPQAREYPLADSLQTTSIDVVLEPHSAVPNRTQS